MTSPMANDRLPPTFRKTPQAEEDQNAIKLYSSEIDKFKQRNFDKNSSQLTDRNIEQLVNAVTVRKKSHQHIAKEFKDTSSFNLISIRNRETKMLKNYDKY